MEISLTWNTIITAAAVLGARASAAAYIVKGVRWMDRQREQDQEIEATKKEQQLVVYGLLACLKGLKEQGCNGPVTEAINKIEKHLNARAHE